MKGFFKVAGKDLIRKSVIQVSKMAEATNLIPAKGCCYPDCVSSLEDALYSLEGGILCYQ